MTFVSHASDEFWELYRSLPPDVQNQAEKQFELFRQNPLHPSLRLKPVGRERVLVVAHTEEGETVRLISARRATRHEQRFYEEE